MTTTLRDLKTNIATERAGEARHKEEDRPKVLVLSSSLLIDRILLYTRFLSELEREGSAKVWASSVKNSRFQDAWNACPAPVEEFPAIIPFKEFPYNYLRRLNEFVWDYRQRPPSRISMWQYVRSKRAELALRLLRGPARILAALRAETLLERNLEGLLLSYARSPEAVNRLKLDRPDVMLTTGPFQYEQPAIIASAKNLGIPTLALIPSWDNLSTKGRMVFSYDGYIVWSEQSKEELHHFYPQMRQAPVYVVGAPQFDVFFQERFFLSREEFCAMQGLRAELPIILYAVGSPNFIAGEHHGAMQLAENIVRGDLGDVQMLVRPHPIHDNGELKEAFAKYAPRVVVQQPSEVGVSLTARSQDERQIMEWVNTFYHASVLVNLFSTVTVDAAIFDRPVVNLDYDPEPGRPHLDLIREVNHLWTHFKPVAESGGVELVNNHAEMVEAIKTCLAHPEMHREKRRWITEFVCGYVDGRCGERMARAVLDFVHNHAKRLI